MRNIIKIDVSGECACACVSNVYDGSDTFKIAFDAAEYAAPQIEIQVNSTTTAYNLEIVDGLAVHNFDYSVFNSVTACKFRYVDGEKLGTWFQILGIYGGTIPAKKTMCVVRVNDFMFSMYFSATATAPVVSYDPDVFDVTDDGELTLNDELSKKIDEITTANVTGITVTTDTDDTITNVTLAYDDGTSTSNACKYDSDGNLIQFGDLSISGW